MSTETNPNDAPPFTSQAQEMAYFLQQRQARKAEEYREEMERLQAGGYDYAGNEDWVKFMRLVGRKL